MYSKIAIHSERYDSKHIKDKVRVNSYKNSNYTPHRLLSFQQPQYCKHLLKIIVTIQRKNERKVKEVKEVKKIRLKD